MQKISSLVCNLLIEFFRNGVYPSKDSYSSEIIQYIQSIYWLFLDKHGNPTFCKVSHKDPIHIHKILMQLYDNYSSINKSKFNKLVFILQTLSKNDKYASILNIPSNNTITFQNFCVMIMMLPQFKLDISTTMNIDNGFINDITDKLVNDYYEISCKIRSKNTSGNIFEDGNIKVFILFYAHLMKVLAK